MFLVFMEVNVYYNLQFAPIFDRVDLMEFLIYFM